ncbi:MAG: 50S ribosomal protein L3 [Nanoarchaeota archaeon]
MPKAHQPRHGSMAYWPRKRAKRAHARVRSYRATKEVLPLAFAGYKAGMTHVMFIDNKKTSPTKGEELSVPVTIIECPPLKVIGIRFLINDPHSRVLVDHFIPKLDKTITLPKHKKEPKAIPDSFDELMLIVATTPKATGIGKKKADIFEIALGGNKEEKFAKAKELLGKDLNVEDVFKEGQLLDAHSITIGKGFQGAVKRFGIGLKNHKSEKSVRTAPLGPWKSQGHIMYRVAHAGKMGYHTRTDFNKWLLKIAKADELKIKGGIINFGLPKSTCLLLKGSIPGHKKRLIKLTRPIRPNHRASKEAPAITTISLESQQGR